MGSREKVGHENLQSRMDGVVFKITTLVARVSLVYRNARPPVMSTSLPGSRLNHNLLRNA